MQETSNSSDRGQPPGETTLPQLNARLKRIVEEQTRTDWVRVRGIAWDVRRSATSGHVRFRLRDDRHSLPCVVLRGLAHQLPFDLENGQRVIVEGQIEVYRVWGELQLLARTIELDTGAAERETLSSLKARAEAERWLAPERKRPLPHSPKTIGLITGGDSRAREDVRGSLHDAGIECRVLPAVVNLEGPEAAQETRAALDTLNEHPSQVDLIVIARGGGNTAQLWAFNDWPLAEAIVHSRAPVLTAIGHRQDETLADLVADARAHTPSLVGATLAQAQPPAQQKTPAETQPEARAATPAVDRPEARDLLPKQEQPVGQEATPATEKPKETDPIWVGVLAVLTVLALMVIARVLGWL